METLKLVCHVTCAKRLSRAVVIFANVLLSCQSKSKMDPQHDKNYVIGYRF